MYNPLFTKIVDSSIWLEDDSTRIVWVTALAVMDRDGRVHLSCEENFARRANVTMRKLQDALAVLEAPDPHKAGQPFDGRRLARTEYGWRVLNAEAHRKLITEARIREQTRKRVYKLRHPKELAQCNANVTQRNALKQSKAIQSKAKKRA